MTEAETAMREALAKMTPGEWIAIDDGVCVVDDSKWDSHGLRTLGSFRSRANAAGIVALRNHTPALLAELDAALERVVAVLSWETPAAAATIRAHITDLRAGNLVRRADVVAYGRTVAAYYRGKAEYCTNCSSSDAAWAKNSALTWTDRAEATERFVANVANGKSDMPEFWTGYGEHRFAADAIAAGAHEGVGGE